MSKLKEMPGGGPAGTILGLEAFIGRVLNTTFVGIFYKSNFDQPTRFILLILCPITGESCVVCGEPACLRR